MAEPLKINCRVCHAKLDVGECEPFERVACPQCGTLIRVPMRFDRYLLEKVCGKGGDSVVYRAIEPELARRVAVKIANETSDIKESSDRFINSAKITGKLVDSGAVPVYNCGVFENHPFLVMRFMEHGDLERKLKHGELPGHAVILKWISDIIPVLIEARNKNIVHHDIKPGNIMLTADDEAKLGDWDLADIREPDDSNTPCSEWASPIYASPERIYCGSEDFRGDIFCLGVTIYELLAGTAPFGLDGDAKIMYERRKNMDFRPISDVVPGIFPELDHLLTGMLDFLPENRPDYEEILRAVLKGINHCKNDDQEDAQKSSGVISWFRKK